MISGGTFFTINFLYSYRGTRSVSFSEVQESRFSRAFFDKIVYTDGQIQTLPLKMSFAILSYLNRTKQHKNHNLYDKVFGCRMAVLIFFSEKLSNFTLFCDKITLFRPRQYSVVESLKQDDL